MQLDCTLGIALSKSQSSFLRMAQYLTRTDSSRVCLVETAVQTILGFRKMDNHYIDKWLYCMNTQ